MPKRDISYYQLGATLYVPADREDLLPILRRAKFANVRSLVICLEDAVAPTARPVLERRVASLFQELGTRAAVPVFLRPASPERLAHLLSLEGVGLADGFVIPKLDDASFEGWAAALAPLRGRFWLMPTLESAPIFDQTRTARLGKLLDSWRADVLALRIGANDLLRCLGLRRAADRTIYRTPLGPLIDRLVCEFAPRGYRLCGPVFNFLGEGDMPLLAEETREDASRGLFSKTAIHPRQVSYIEAALRPTPEEWDAARALLLKDAPPVFRLHGAMQETACHAPWARQILERAQYFPPLAVCPAPSAGVQAL